MTLQAYRLLDPWSETEVTYNSAANLWGEGYGSVILDGSVRAGDWVALDVTELVRGWQDGRWPNDGIGISAATPGDINQASIFVAHEIPYLGPRLRLIYATPSPTPTSTPTLTVTPTETPQVMYLPLMTR